MKQGHFWQIPESPRDMRPLWDRATPLTERDRPPWLDPADIGAYRTFPAVDPNTLDAAHRAVWQAELDELEFARMFIDDDDPAALRLFIAKPVKEPVWSIGDCVFSSSLAVTQPWLEFNPVFTAAQVTDLPASYVADPFVVYRAPDVFMFFEVWNWHENKGQIAVATTKDARHWTYMQSVLVEPFHLSYPHVFSVGDDWYMTPECHQAGAVRLYRARQFPFEWEHVGDLLTGSYFADTTLFQHQGLWWMMTDGQAETNDTLRLFYAEELLGPWVEHPRSPVVRGDPFHARPAGKVLVLPDKILRFAQSCVPEYGTDVRAIEITKLTTTDYAERPALDRPMLGPSGQGWNACGMHHVDIHVGNAGVWWALVDGWVEE